MKKILEFRHWIFGFIGCVIFVSFMAYQQHRAADKYKDHRAEYCSALTATAEQKEACIEERTSARDYLPWRYELFSWPEGITTWAIILTGFAIAWQSSETRKAAAATQGAVHEAKASRDLAEETAKRQLRAYLCYRQARIFVDNDGKARAVIELENTGQTPAHAVQGVGSAGFAVQVVQPGPPLMPLKSVAVVGAGKSFNISLPISQWSEKLVAKLSQGISMYFVIGEFSYRDIFREKEWTTKFQIGIGGKFGPLYLETEAGKSFYRMMTDSEGNDAT